MIGPVFIFGCIAVVAVMALRIILWKPQRRFWKDLLCLSLEFFALVCCGVTYAPITVFLAALLAAVAKLTAARIARRNDMDPKRHNTAGAPTRHGRAAPNPRHHAAPKPEPQQWTPEPPRPEPPRPEPPRPEPPRPAPPMRQTLRCCVRCGYELTGAFCGECGYDHTTQAVCLLRYIDPERLQIAVKK